MCSTACLCDESVVGSAFDVEMKAVRWMRKLRAGCLMRARYVRLRPERYHGLNSTLWNGASESDSSWSGLFIVAVEKEEHTLNMPDTSQSAVSRSRTNSANSRRNNRNRRQQMSMNSLSRGGSAKIRFEEAMFRCERYQVFSQIEKRCLTQSQFVEKLKEICNPH